MKPTAFVLLAASLLGTVDAARAADATTPVYQVTVVEPSIKAINYDRLNGTTNIELRPTVLLPHAEGTAAVKSEMGTYRVKAQFKSLESPTKFDPSVLTYVLWAVSPEGRAENLGEVVPRGGTSFLTATTDLQTFALIVTAEPYFGVSQPGNIVVFENAVPEKSKVKFEVADVKYEFQKRGQYTTRIAPADMKPVQMDKKVPFELYQARNAVKIAKAEGADSYAPEVFNKAASSLREAEGYQARRHWYSTKKREVVQASRRAVQSAEDSRLIAMKRKDDERVAQQVSSAQQLASQAQTDRAAAEEAGRQSDLLRQKAENEKAALRAALRIQLSSILSTRDSARGLIMSMPNALFDVGKYDLNASVREKLAKISGVVLGHPGLKLAIEGHADSTGTDAFNQKLSEKRADAVKDYMAQAGIPVDDLTSMGYGITRPIASNATPEGRKLNRRVEIIVSGDVIGAEINSSSSTVVPSEMNP